MKTTLPTAEVRDGRISAGNPLPARVSNDTVPATLTAAGAAATSTGTDPAGAAPITDAPAAGTTPAVSEAPAAAATSTSGQAATSTATGSTSTSPAATPWVVSLPRQDNAIVVLVECHAFVCNYNQGLHADQLPARLAFGP